MHRSATASGPHNEWPNGRPSAPRVCAVTGYPCRAIKRQHVSLVTVVCKCGDCGRRWMEMENAT